MKAAVYCGPYEVVVAGCHETVHAGVEPGETVTVHGAGPVGLMAAYSAQLTSARRVFVVSQELPLSAAPGAPAHFDKREPGYSKVLLHPHEDLPA